MAGRTKAIRVRAGKQAAITTKARHGKDFYSRAGKKGGGSPVLQGIKNGTLKIVPVK
jgi:hypothetical protein